MYLWHEVYPVIKNLSRWLIAILVTAGLTRRQFRRRTITYSGQLEEISQHRLTNDPFLEVTARHPALPVVGLLRARGKRSIRAHSGTIFSHAQEKQHIR
jgi:hypothetical protein